MTIVFATLVAAVALANVGLVREILAGLARRHP
jgi:hypothetical protein